MNVRYWIGCCFFGITFFSTAVFANVFYVSPTGSVTQAVGSKESPFNTVAAARDAARKDGSGPHRIVLLPGAYYIDQTIELNASDRGLTIEALQAGTVTIYGGQRVEGWRKINEHLWAASIEGVKEGRVDFRALVVNGQLAQRARYPEKGTFLHRSVFDVNWLSSVGGGWERKPTQVELTTMRYDPKDLPAEIQVKNAELRIYHMWDESLVGVASNDCATATLSFSVPSKSPAGAFGVKKYVIFNTREGMSQPGQWYLDRVQGEVVYWPLAGEDMTTAHVVAPRLETVFKLMKGGGAGVAQKITLRGFSVQATTTPLEPAGFAASAYKGAVEVIAAENCALEKMEIANVGGQGVNAWGAHNMRIENCHIHAIGACGIRIGGRAVQICNNHIHHTGRYHPSAVALNVSHSWKDDDPVGAHVYRNEIHDSPYSGMIVSGGGHCIEENLISRVMQELHDGAAIYGGAKKTIVRGNIVRDVVAVGSGYGASAYYFDEGSAECIIERNVAVDVQRPVHEHITQDLTIRENVFFSSTNMVLSFPRSCRIVFSGNTLYTPGTVSVVSPNAITIWTNNVIFSGTQKQGFSIDGAMPVAQSPARRTWPFPVPALKAMPSLDGEIGTDEWQGAFSSVDREVSRWGASGAPAFCKFGYDATNLYIAVNTVLFDIGQLKKGSIWGSADGVLLAVPVQGGVLVAQGFSDGSLNVLGYHGLSSEIAQRCGQQIRFAAKAYGKTKGDWKSGWRCEWSIPFASLGLTPVQGLKIPFNLAIYRSEDRVTRCLEGTLAEPWNLSDAAVLQLK